MRVDRRRLAYLALCILDEASERSRAMPVERSLAIRLALACLYALGDCERSWVETYWDAIVIPDRTADTQAGIHRHNMAAAAVQALARGVGIIVAPGFSGYRAKLLGGSERALADTLRRARYSREIVATKGRPYSAAGQRVMADQLARGPTPDGTRQAAAAAVDTDVPLGVDPADWAKADQRRRKWLIRRARD